MSMWFSHMMFEIVCIWIIEFFNELIKLKIMLIHKYDWRYLINLRAFFKMSLNHNLNHNDMSYDVKISYYCWKGQMK
jgi:hypothetical protein